MSIVYHIAESDALVDLFSRARSQRKSHARRDEALDPLIFAAAFASGPITRNHSVPNAPSALWADSGTSQDRKRAPYVSRQGPRGLRLQNQNQQQVPEPKEKENVAQSNDPPKPTEILSPSISLTQQSQSTSLAIGQATSALSHGTQPTGSGVEVRCMARTRIPTPHGTVFLHLYHNNRDSKEHLAVVVDSAQYSDSHSTAPPIRSHSLDAIWSDGETEDDRILRGAYVGRLTPETRRASRPIAQSSPHADVPLPLVRIHSECFTGETIGSMRCDCGEQLDEAIRLISQPIQVPSSPPATIPGRGAVVYLRQEGRGIGLLSKIRAYNLQDLGHDTVTANLMLGHKADERGYEIAVAILKDLELGSEQGEGIRLLTNNPDKVMALEKEGLRVVERVAMVPRSWRCSSDLGLTLEEEERESRKPRGVTMIGGDMARGADLDKYLRTKVLRMGHMLPLSMVEGRGM
ncbi:GTP cyclohydrolase II-domain-containing protein [Melanogaster broomeanus]|nr:GTP cyclohydrolase II-domain-containing protein [Melanogaster broomeanus]